MQRDGRFFISRREKPQMTKAEQKRIEKAAREAFTKKAFGYVLDAIFESSVKNNGSPQIRVALKKGNRYIAFHRYAQDFNIQLYSSGDVDIEFKEFCHQTRLYRIFEYNSNTDVQEAFLEQFRKDVLMVITEFIEQADWHIVLDYLPLEYTENWRDIFIDSLEPAANPQEPFRWKPDWVNPYGDEEEPVQ
jgi:hypothetical protein